ncbi:hypothetical protein J6590_056215 [Homalodisca vitripennis]|nr:hypothetical protein J6590_056215 [Homalodisca vitripennis]
MERLMWSRMGGGGGDGGPRSLSISCQGSAGAARLNARHRTRHATPRQPISIVGTTTHSIHPIHHSLATSTAAATTALALYLLTIRVTYRQLIDNSTPSPSCFVLSAQSKTVGGRGYGSRVTVRQGHSRTSTLCNCLLQCSGEPPASQALPSARVIQGIQSR